MCLERAPHVKLCVDSRDDLHKCRLAATCRRQRARVVGVGLPLTPMMPILALQGGERNERHGWGDAPLIEAQSDVLEERSVVADELGHLVHVVHVLARRAFALLVRLRSAFLRTVWTAMSQLRSAAHGAPLAKDLRNRGPTLTA